MVPGEGDAAVHDADRVVVLFPRRQREERAAVDITTPAVRALRVSGAVVGADGPLNASGFSLTPSSESDEGAVLTRIEPMLVQAVTAAALNPMIGKP